MSHTTFRQKMATDPKYYGKFKSCPICNEDYVKIPKRDASIKEHKSYNGHIKRITLDHILPKQRYTDDFRLLLIEKSGFRNIKYMCAECNSQRGSPFNHCVAAMIMYRLTKGDTRFYDGKRTNLNS